MNSHQLENLSMKIDGLSPVARKVASIGNGSLVFSTPIEAVDELENAGIDARTKPYAAALIKAETEEYLPWYMQQ